MRRARTLILCGSLILTTSLLSAQPPGQAKRPKAEFDETSTPLQRAIEAAVERRRGQGKPTPGFEKKKCANRGRACDDPTDATDGEIRNPNGKLVGKKVRTRTVLEYDHRGQRDDRGGPWDPVRVRGRRAGQGTERSGNFGGNGRAHRAALFPDSAVNDDRDCFDSVEDRWKSEAECFDGSGLLLNLEEVEGGCIHVDTGTFLAGDPTDGLEDPCYDADDAFRGTSLEELIDEDPPKGLDNDGDGLFGEDPPGNGNEDGDCVDARGNVFFGAACFDGGELKAGRVELIDEDGPDDLDGDGSFGEDPPETDDLDAACSDFGASRGLPPGLGDPVDGECDLTRAVIVAVNREAMAQSGKKLFAADDEGHFLDPDDEDLSDEEKEALNDAVEFGQEQRRVVLDEVFSVICPQPGAELTEDGQCAVPGTDALRADTRFLGSAAMTGSGFTGSETHRTMMGFTFAPPVIEWGYGISEEACLFGVCVTLFEARIGYEFDVAAGLRLPVEVELSGLPDSCTRGDLSPPCALAATEVTLDSVIEPLDFSVEEYRQFCQDHGIANGTTIANCDRFAVPEFLDSHVPDSLIPALDDALAQVGLEPFERDGAELVAQESIFAGIKVAVVGIPLINWALDSSVDLPAMCTMSKIVQEFSGALEDPPFTLLDLAEFGSDPGTTAEILAAIDDFVPNCQSFTTPYGFEDGLLRTFPFTEGTVLEVGADCAEARLNGDVLVVRGKVMPICTGLILGMEGASLGIGLGLDVKAGSNLITAEWSPAGDALRQVGESGELAFLAEPDSPISVGGTLFDVSEDFDLRLVIDNFDAGDFRDHAEVSIDDFTYFLNTLQLTLTATLEFGGILSPIPDLASFDVFSFSLSLGDLGLPIGQHSGVGPVTTGFFVENYGLQVDGYPAADDPGRRDDDLLSIEPGLPGDYLVATRNLGSVSGDFDGFTFALSNEIQDLAASPDVLTFVIDQDTDGDGLVNEDPPGPEGELPEIQDEDGDGLVNEDPPDEWQAEFVGTEIVQVPAHAWSTGGAPPTNSSATEVVVLRVTPFRHFMTAPGFYPVRIGADSRQARELGLPRTDPQGNFRLGVTDAAPGAWDVVWVEVLPFQSVEVAAQPEATSGKPGVGRAYVAAGTNGGNVADALSVAKTFRDFNSAGCTLTTLGSDADGCPFRAVPTAVELDWTTFDGFPGRLPSMPSPPEPDDLLAPGFFENAEFSIQVPADWAGMENTTYEIAIQVNSESDPTVGDQVVVRHTVTATMESMTRYIGLEIRELIGKIEAANAQGVKTGGLLPISLYPARLTNDRALERILAGDLRGAATAHSANVRIVEGFLQALAGGGSKKIPAELVTDWRLQAEALVADIAKAADSPIPSAGG